MRRLLEPNRWKRFASARASSDWWKRLRQDFTPESLPRWVLEAPGPVSVWFLSQTGEYTAAAVAPHEALKLYSAANMTLYVPIQHREAVEAGRACAEALGVDPKQLRLSLFASRKGAHTPTHFDRSGGTTLQLWGRKDWTLSLQDRVPWPHENHVAGLPPRRELRWYVRDLLPGRMPRAASKVAMRPGTLLYVPPGVWHSTQTKEDAISLDFQVAVDDERWVERVALATRFLMLQHEELRRPAMISGSPLDEAAHVLELLQRAISNLKSEDLIGEFEPRGRTGRYAWSPLSFAAVTAIVSGVATVELGNVMRERSAKLAMPEEWLPMLRALRAGEQVDARSLSRLVPATREEADDLLRVLAGRGVIVPV